jgi:hypothetical protein
MSLGAYQYVGNDGITYQIGADSSTTDSGTGNLQPAAGYEPVFPCFDVPRCMICKNTDNVSPVIIRIPCDVSNDLFLNGPGTELYVLGELYTVLQCVGELRFVVLT